MSEFKINTAAHFKESRPSRIERQQLLQVMDQQGQPARNILFFCFFFAFFVPIYLLISLAYTAFSY